MSEWAAPPKQSRLSPIDVKGVPPHRRQSIAPSMRYPDRCGAIARRKPARRIQALIPGRCEKCRAARSGRGSVEVVGLLSRVFG